jgi:hypothetical protein
MFQHFGIKHLLGFSLLCLVAPSTLLECIVCSVFLFSLCVSNVGDELLKQKVNYQVFSEIREMYF